MKQDLRKNCSALLATIGILCMFGLVSCQKETSDVGFNKERVSIAQAKTSFEKELSNYGEPGSDLLGLSAVVAAHSDDHAITYDLNPGEYTPVWDKAHSNPAGRTAAVSTPIIPEYCYIAVREYYAQDSVIKMTAVLTYQKLVALRVNGSDVRNYIATIVPTEDYYMNNQAIDMTFKYGDDVDNFCGLVLLHTLDGAFFELQKYVNGNITKQLNVAQTISLEDFIDKVNAIAGVVNFGRLPIKNTYTRMWYDDDPEGLLAYWTTSSLTTNQSVSIMRCVGNGYGRTCNVSSIYSRPFTAGSRNFKVTNRGYTYSVRDMVIGARPGLVNTTIKESRDFNSGGINYTTLRWEAVDGNINGQVQITVPTSELDNFYNASGYYNGMNPPN